VDPSKSQSQSQESPDELKSLGDLAEAASTRAKMAGTASAHKAAADAHHKAAKEALAQDQDGRANKHEKLADFHRGEAASASSSSASSSSQNRPKDPVPDEEDQQNADPLLTWVSARTGG
jgi:hypothetical protein